MENKKSRKSSRSLAEKVKLRLPQDYPWKVLGALVADLRHLLTESEQSRLGAIIRDRDYARYLALSEEWGPQSTYLTDRPIASVRAIYQVTSLLKKYRFPSNDMLRRENAFKKFLDGELTCRRFNRYGIRNIETLNEGSLSATVIRYAKHFLLELLGFDLPSFDERTLWSRHGPGANLDTKDRRISPYFKYADWPYSCTSRAYQEAKVAIQSDERWLGALEESYRQKFDIPRHMILDQEAFWSNVIHIVDSNRVAFVPKNALTDRSIAIEPSLNLYLQLGIDGFIRRRLRRWNIDLDWQGKNQFYAQQGSIHWDHEQNYSTLDLAAASDTISVSLCHELLPVLWFDHLMKLRSPYGVLNGEKLRYAKISSMGNGFTFALETAIFCSIVYGVRRAVLGCADLNDCAVYGDDIIVPNTIAQVVVQHLNLCGFSVNTEKSFIHGPFRESCGSDWFKGQPVRPVFFTDLPSSVMEIWTDYNRIRRLLSLRFMVDESNTCQLIASWVPPKFRGIVGPCSDEQFDSYMHCDLPTEKTKFSRSHYAWRYKSLTVTSDPQKGDQFLMRKLMHPLRDMGGETYASKYCNTWMGLTLAGNGSQFIITKPGLVTVAYTYSVADNWRSTYAEILPEPIRPRKYSR